MTNAEPIEAAAEPDDEPVRHWWKPALDTCYYRCLGCGMESFGPSNDDGEEDPEWWGGVCPDTLPTEAGHD